MLRAIAAPEVFEEFPEPSLQVVGCMDRNYSLHEETETKELFELASLTVVPGLKAICWNQWLEESPRQMWEHNGKCQYGRRSYMMALCAHCIRSESRARHADALEEAAAKEELDPEEVAVPNLEFEDQAAVLTVGKTAAQEMIHPVGDVALALGKETSKVIFVDSGDIHEWGGEVSRQPFYQQKVAGRHQELEVRRRIQVRNGRTGVAVSFDMCVGPRS